MDTFNENIMKYSICILYAKLVKYISSNEISLGPARHIIHLSEFMLEKLKCGSRSALVYAQYS